MLRKAEAKNCVNALKNGLGIDVHLFDESKLFFSRLKGVIDPEQKGKLLGISLLNLLIELLLSLEIINF